MVSLWQVLPGSCLAAPPGRTPCPASFLQLASLIIPGAPGVHPGHVLWRQESDTAESAWVKSHPKRTCLGPPLPTSPEGTVAEFCCVGCGQDPGARLCSGGDPGSGHAGLWNAGWGSGVQAFRPCSWGSPSGWKTGAPGLRTLAWGSKTRAVSPAGAGWQGCWCPRECGQDCWRMSGGVGPQFPAVCAGKPELRQLCEWCGGYGGWGGVH